MSEIRTILALKNWKPMKSIGSYPHFLLWNVPTLTGLHSSHNSPIEKHKFRNSMNRYTDAKWDELPEEFLEECLTLLRKDSNIEV